MTVQLQEVDAAHGVLVESWVVADDVAYLFVHGVLELTVDGVVVLCAYGVDVLQAACFHGVIQACHMCCQGRCAFSIHFEQIIIVNYVCVFLSGFVGGYRSNDGDGVSVVRRAFAN